MRRKKLAYSLLSILFFLVLILGSVIVQAKNPSLKVYFLDVGQGDSILICQGDTQILIDGGPDGKAVMEKLGRYVPFWDREIEAVIATHPDSDHIAGLIDVLENYQVDEVIDTGVSSDSQAYQKFKAAIEEKRIGEIEAKTGTDLKLGNGAELDILYPNGSESKDNPKDTNASSVVAKLKSGKTSFLFTGDLPFDGETVLGKSGIDVTADILKIAHHGSKYATSEEFLEKVDPKEAIISVGKGNRYGHPGQEVIDRLKKDGINIRRTDEEGDIEYDYNFQ